MTKKIFIMVMVVVVAIFIGVTITVQKVNDPQLRRLLNQQSEMLLRIKNIEQALGTAPGQEQGQGDSALKQQPATNLERKIDALTRMISMNARGGQQAARQTPPPEDFTKVHEIKIGTSPVKGEKNAPVTIVSFVDLECPYSAKFQPVFNEAVKNSPKEVKMVMKNYPLPFHKQGIPAAKAALAAGEQGKYWEMIDLILKNQRQLSDEKYKDLAADLGLNVDSFTKDLEKKGPEWEGMIKEDMTLGSKVGVRGTPTYYINGRKTMSRTPDALKAEIEGILNSKDK